MPMSAELVRTRKQSSLPLFNAQPRQLPPVDIARISLSRRTRRKSGDSTHLKRNALRTLKGAQRELLVLSAVDIWDSARRRAGGRAHWDGNEESSFSSREARLARSRGRMMGSRCEGLGKQHEPREGLAHYALCAEGKHPSRFGHVSFAIATQKRKVEKEGITKLSAHSDVAGKLEDAVGSRSFPGVVTEGATASKTPAFYEGPRSPGANDICLAKTPL